MKKRMISLLLAMVLVLGFIPYKANAAQTVSGTPEISVENTWGTKGDTVEVDITIKNNPGILGANLSVSWSDGLTLMDAENGKAFSNLSYQEPSRYDAKGTSFIWYGSSLRELLDGTVLTMTFQIAEDAKKSQTITVKGLEVVDKDDNPLQIEFNSGMIEVIDYLPGDVNKDNSVSIKDLTTTAKYISDGCVTDPDGFNVTLNDVAGDVNADGSISIKDLTTMAKYISDGCVTDPDSFNITLKPGLAKCGHENMAQIDYKAVTCTQDGNVQHFYCDDCGNYFNDKEGTVELTWDQIVLVSEGHKEVIDQAVPPSYTQPGLTEGSHCSVCGTVFVAQEEVPMLQASYHSITYRNLNGAESPEPSSYAEHEGLLEMPEPAAPGYVFVGWYTASQGGTVVDYIPAGSTQDYILYARWDLVTYNIRYFEAPENDNETTYTVEDEIYLNDPNWSGLGFTGWTEANDKVQTEIRGGKTYYKIAAGTTGDLDLTANWKLMRNVAVPGVNTLMLAQYNPETEHYLFTYELGTIENVVLEELNSSTLGLYRHTGAGDFTLTMSQENTMEESFADSITQTISKSISSSSEWEESKEWAKEISNEHNTHVDISMEFGGDASPVKAGIETGYGYANTNTDSWGGSESKGGSYGEETENGEEIGSSFSYLKSMTTASEASVTISGASPHGYYDYVQAGNIRVFGVVTYDAESGNVYMNTYSILDNMHGIVLYYPDVNSLNNPTCETLQYSIPRDNIQEVIANSYFIEYEAEGGVGEINKTLHTVGGVEKLAKNTFTREGYLFMGWETRDENGLSTGTYTDEQIINTSLSANGQKVTMYALWEKIDYSIEYQSVKPSNCSTQISSMPNPTGCKYDENVTLAEAPVLSGYTFAGWYTDSGCTEGHKLGDAGQVLEKANLTKEHNGVVKAYPKWVANTYKITFNTNGGTMSTTSMNVVFDTLYGTLPVPTKNDSDTDYVFLGWFNSNGVQVTNATYARVAGNHTLEAKWLKTKSTVYYRNDTLQPNEKDEKVTDTSPYYEMCSPGLDLAALKAQGYTRLLVEYEFWTDEIDQGNKHIMFMPYYKCHYDYDFYTQNFNDQASGWDDAEGSTYIRLDSGYLDEGCGFWIGYGAHGSGADDYWLGDTTITITALKN